jgi:muramoyltetrapeptide carboxypeptidase
MTKIMPHMLKKGDTIGIISPSSPLAGILPKRFERGIKELEKLGYRVKVGKATKFVTGHKAGTATQRIEDLHEMFENNEIKAIIASIGGYNSNDMLDLIDFNLIKKNPKIFCGYSDITSLLCGINSKTELVTFYGPALMSQFADYGGAIAYTRDWFVKVLSSTKPIGKIAPSKEFTYEFLSWEKDDTRPKKLSPSPGWNILKSGVAEGELTGGHLGTVLHLAGSKYFPDFKDKIFFWEETESETALTDSFLEHFKTLGVFDQIKGMIIGRINPLEYKTSAEGYDFHKIILEATQDYEFPIISDMDFGHTDPMFTIPYGIKAKIDADRNELSLLEAAVI